MPNALGYTKIGGDGDDIEQSSLRGSILVGQSHVEKGYSSLRYTEPPNEMEQQSAQERQTEEQQRVGGNGRVASTIVMDGLRAQVAQLEVSTSSGTPPPPSPLL